MRHTRSIHSAYDDVVTIVTDCGHSCDAAQPEKGRGNSVKFAHKRAELPDSSIEAIVDKHGKLRDHHAQVGKGQVDVNSLVSEKR